MTGELGAPMAYLPPLDGIIRVTSVFGLDRGSYRHGGIDLALQHESVYRRPVKAPAAGTVLAVWTTDRPSTRDSTVRDGFPYGNAVALRDDADVLWRLLHFDEPPMARVGERVAAGQTLGLCDSTGNSTGHHLHLDASPLAAPVDRATFRVHGVRGSTRCASTRSPMPVTWATTRRCFGGKSGLRAIGTRWP